MSTARLPAGCLWLLLAAVFACGASTQRPLQEVLAQADEARSTDPAAFRVLRAELEARKHEADSAQREWIAYLGAYAIGIRGDYDGAIKAAEELLADAGSVDIQARAGALLVNLHALSRRFPEGLRQLDRTLALLDDIQDPDYREHVLGVAAVIHNQTGQSVLARRYAEQVLESTTSERARCFAGQSRLEAMSSLPDVEVTRSQLNDLVALCSAQGERVVANVARAMLARKMAAEGARREAIALLRRHLDEVRNFRYAPLVSEFESLLGELEFEQGNLDAAGRHAQAAIEVIAGAEYTLPLVRAHLVRHRVAQARGDLQESLDSYRAYAEADKGYLNEVQARDMAYQIVRHETLEQTRAIELLNQQNTVLELQQRIAEQRAQNNGLIVVLLTVLLASIAFWGFRTKRIQMRLRRMSETDMLTGVCNRRHFTGCAEKALAHCARSGEPLAIVMFDLDHFKDVNDLHGHAAGDWALRQVAEACASLCGPNDSLGRLGGEEFAILMPGSDAQAAMEVAENAQERLRAIDSSANGYRLEVSASFGVTDTTLSGYDFARLLSHADRALYRAKREGRRRVRLYEARLVARLPLERDGQDPARSGDEAGEGADPRRSAAVS